MQHNAKITIIVDSSHARPIRFWIRSHADQPSFRKLLHLAMRGQRRRVSVNPEQIALDIWGYFWKKTEVYYYQPDFAPLWRYKLDLESNTPTIYITHPSGDTTKQNLFQFVGQERTPREPRKAKAPKVTQGRRGRPSHLQMDPRISDAKRAEMRAELEEMLSRPVKK